MPIVETRFYVFNTGCIRTAKDSLWIQKYLENNWRELTLTPKQAHFIAEQNLADVTITDMRIAQIPHLQNYKTKANRI